MELVIVSGQLLAHIVNAIITITLGHDPMFYVIFYNSSYSCYSIIFGMLINKESPRWFVAKGKLLEFRCSGD